MRLVLFLNNVVGWQVARFLRDRDEEIAALFLHPEEDRKFGDQILSTLNVPPDRLWLPPQLRNRATLMRLADLRPDIGISVSFGYILQPEMLEIPRRGCINLHAAYLPWNRGWHTNVWPILDGSPAGVSIHYMDKGVDTGDIISQRLVPVEPTDTGGSLHRRLSRELIGLFRETWPLIAQGKETRTPQNHALATVHRRADLSPLDRIDLNARCRARDLLNLLRARTYPPYPSAYFIDGSLRIYVRLQLLNESDALRDGFRQEAACLDPDRHYNARDLLQILVGGHPSHDGCPYLLAGSQRIYLRAQFLREEDIDPKGIPNWDSF